MALSSPLHVGLYENNILIEHYCLSEQTSEALPQIFEKMSKTYKNFVWLDFKPNDMFVKIMEIWDELIIKYFQHCTPLYFSEIQKSGFKKLTEGEEVTFEITKGAKGPQASNIKSV
mgnify:CR=1 FL=1